MDKNFNKNLNLYHSLNETKNLGYEIEDISFESDNIVSQLGHYEESLKKLLNESEQLAKSGKSADEIKKILLKMKIEKQKLDNLINSGKGRYEKLESRFKDLVKIKFLLDKSIDEMTDELILSLQDQNKFSMN